MTRGNNLPAPEDTRFASPRPSRTRCVRGTVVPGPWPVEQGLDRTPPMWEARVRGRAGWGRSIPALALGFGVTPRPPGTLPPMHRALPSGTQAPRGDWVMGTEAGCAQGQGAAARPGAALRHPHRDTHRRPGSVAASSTDEVFSASAKHASRGWRLTWLSRQLGTAPEAARWHPEAWALPRPRPRAHRGPECESRRRACPRCASPAVRVRAVRLTQGGLPLPPLGEASARLRGPS